MDICTPMSWERKRLQKLIKGYDDKRAELLAYLETIIEQWGNEFGEDDKNDRTDHEIDQIVYRMDLIGRWMCTLIEAEITFEEIDEVIIFEDEGEEDC
jgi:hypothetical protein